MGFKFLFFMWIFYINGYDRVSTTLLYGNVKATWDEAHEICGKSGGKLADLSTVLETDSEQIRQEVTSGRRIWINGYHNRTNFMWTYGCMNLANTAVPYKNFGRSISLLNCVNFCGFSDYVAMRLFHCYCVSPSDLAVAENPQCQAQCRGDSTNCGGTTQVFVYKRLLPGEIPFEDAAEDKNCVFVTKNSSENSISGDNNAMGNVIWGTEDCERELDGYVFQPHNVNPSVDVYKVYYSIRDWVRSLTSSVWNGTLANIYNTTQRVETMRSNEKYWIGLYRADFTPGIEDRCDALVFGQNGEINDTIKDLCTERHTVLCEREDPTTSALLPSTFETTEAVTTTETMTTTEEMTSPMADLDGATTELEMSTSSNISDTPGAGSGVSDGNQGSPTTIPVTTAFQTTKATIPKPAVKPKGKLAVPSTDEATTTQDSTTNSSDAGSGIHDHRKHVFNDDGKLHISAVILIIVLAVLLLLIFVLLIILLMRKRNRNKDFRVQTQNTSYLNKGFSEEGNVLLVSKDQEQTPPPKPVRQKSATNVDVILNSNENVNLSIDSTNSLPKAQYSTFKPQENHNTTLAKAESLDIPFIDSSRDNLDRIVREPSKTDEHYYASLNKEPPVSRDNSPDVQKASSLGNIDLHIDAMFPNHDSVESLDDESSPMKIEDTDAQDQKDRKNSDTSSSSSNKTDLTEMNTLDISYENGMGNFTPSPGSDENINM